MNANDTFGTVKGLANDAGKTFENAGNVAKNAMNGLRDEAKTLIDQGEDCTRSHIASGVATAFVGGLIIGFVLGRNTQPSFRKLYLEDPMARAGTLALALLTPMARALNDSYGNAKSAARHAAHQISEVKLDPAPVLDSARHLGQRLKFW